jgi:hypothetical protein
MHGTESSWNDADSTGRTVPRLRCQSQKIVSSFPDIAFMFDSDARLSFGDHWHYPPGNVEMGDSAWIGSQTPNCSNCEHVHPSSLLKRLNLVMALWCEIWCARRARIDSDARQRLSFHARHDAEVDDRTGRESDRALTICPIFHAPARSRDRGTLADIPVLMCRR